MDILGLTYSQLARVFRQTYGKGEQHAAAVYRALFTQPSPDIKALPAFKASPSLADRIQKDWAISLPSVERCASEAGVSKLALRLSDGLRIETVIISMVNHTTVCVSSQVGCRMGCRFCRTGRLGLKRNLSAQEIVAQVYVAKVMMGLPVRNVVFMGMGEPLDNCEALIQSVRVLEDQRGLDIAKRHITVSTAGLVSGVERLARLDWPHLRVAVSLNAPNDQVRAQLMPVNRQNPLAALKTALKTLPLARGNVLFVEYVLIGGINDHPDHAQQVAAFLADLPVKVNLIPYNHEPGGSFGPPNHDAIERFRRSLVNQGLFVRLRCSKGDAIQAACGQLGGSIDIQQPSDAAHAMDHRRLR